MFTIKENDIYQFKDGERVRVVFVGEKKSYVEYLVYEKGIHKILNCYLLEKNLISRDGRYLIKWQRCL